MEWNAVYDSEDAIPADIKQFFHLVDGKWKFNFAKFKGLAELANPSLAGNKEAILEEKRQADEKAKAEKERADTAEAKVKQLEKPGMISITQSEKDDYDKYKALGTVKDVDAKIKNEQILNEEVGKTRQEKDIRILAQQVGVDPDALVDFKINTAHGKDVTLGKEKRKVKVGNKEVEKEVLVVIHKDTVNGEEKTRTELFSEFSTNKGLPKYLVDGIYATTSVEEVGKKKERGFHLPDTSIRKTEKKEEQVVTDTVKSIVQRGNDSRNTRQLPFLKKSATKKEE